MKWPDDADGDVLRRLADQVFDFDKQHLIDFVVDFDDWPPPELAVAVLEKKCCSPKIYEPEAASAGYVLLRISGRVTYEFVTSMQNEISALMKPFCGVCNSWGVLH